MISIIRIGMAIMALLIAIVMTGCENANAPKGEQPLTILFTSNLNGMLDSCTCLDNLQGGITRLYTEIQTQRTKNPNLLLVDSGDFSVYEDPIKNAFFLEAIKKMQFSAMTLGEIDLLEKPDFIAWQTTNLPVFSCAVSTSSNQQLLPSSRIITRSGIRIGLLSLMDSDNYTALPSELQKILQNQKTYTLPDPFLHAKTILSNFEGKVDIVLVLSHLSEKNNLKLGGLLPQNSIILAGHDENLLKKPRKIGNAIMVQAGYAGYHLGKLTIKRSHNELFTVTHKLIPITQKVPRDPMISQIMLQYFKSLEQSALKSQHKDKKSEYIYIYSNQRCGYCHNLVAKIQKNYPNYKIERIHIDTSTGYQRYMAQDPKDNLLPLIQVKSIQLCGKNEINAWLFKLLEAK